MEGSPQSVGIALRYLAYCAFAFTMLIVGGDLLYILRNYTRYPFGDHWIWLARLYESGPLFTITTQYNEHRLVIPGLFYLLDHRLFGSSNALLIVVSLLLQAGCALLLILPVWRHESVAAPVRLIFAGFTGILMFWFIQGENFFYPFSLCMACSNLGILAALYFMGQAVEKGDRETARIPWVWVAILASALWGTFSYGHGLFVWPILLMAAWTTRLPGRRIALVAVWLVITWGVYFLHYHTPLNRPSPLAAILHPLKIAHYVVLMMGLPLFGADRADLRVSMNIVRYVVSAGGVLAGLILCARFVWRRGGDRSQTAVFYHAVMGLCLGAALVTAVNRSEFPLSQALSGRYAAVPLLFWLSMAALATLYLAELEGGAGAGTAIWCAVLMTAALASLPEQYIKGSYFSMRSASQKAAALSITMEAPESETVATELGALSLVQFVDQRWKLSSGRPSMFARSRIELLNQPLLSRFRLAPPGSCMGVLDLASRYQSGSKTASKLIGWAWGVNPKQELKEIFITDEQMVVRGLGTTHTFRPDVANQLGDEAMTFAGFQAFAPLPAADGGSYKAFAALPDGQSVCQIGEPRKLAAP